MSRTGDDELVAAAARRLGWQVTALVGCALLLLVGLVTVLLVHEQRAATDSLLRSAAATADDVGDPPAGTWLVLQRNGRLDVSIGIPRAVQDALAQARAGSRPGAGRFEDVQGATESGYRVLTRRRGDEVVQVVADLTSEHRQRDRALGVMALTTGLALVLAGVLGWVIAHRAVRPLARALLLQRAFVADASHELRTPLTLLFTRTQVLARGLSKAGASTQTQLDAVGVVSDVQRLGEVVDDLLAAADPRPAADEDEVDVHQLVREAVSSAQAHAEAAGVTLRVRQGHELLRVRASEAGLRRALLSLLDNAIDHSPHGGEVTVAATGRRSHAVVTVADEGPGVAPAERTALFARFHSGGHRAGRTNYGLGLALAHDLANRYGGHLRLLHTTEGAAFELSLPTAAPRKR